MTCAVDTSAYRRKRVPCWSRVSPGAGGPQGRRDTGSYRFASASNRSQTTPRLEEFWVDAESDEYLGAVDNVDNTIWMRFVDFELRLPDPDRWWWLEFHDRDLAFDDYAGWMAFDQGTFQQLADCGQATWVLTDADMDEYETRVRFVELEVESW